MDWTRLGSLFLLELGFGLFASLLLVRSAPLGPFFFRLLGGFAAAATAVGALLPRAAGRPSGALVVAGALLAAVAFLLLMRPLAVGRRSIVLGLAALGSFAALAPSVLEAGASVGALGLASSVGSGLLVGTIAVAMVLGHWYLVVPSLDVAFLRRANFATVGALGGKLLAAGALLAVSGSELASTSLFRPMGLFHLGTRGLVGLLVPLAFAALVAGCLRHRNTRSATGILYASTVLVLIGEAVGLALWGSYGLPL